MEGIKHEIEFYKGEKKKDTIKKLSKSGKQHGSRIEFRAAKEFLGEDAHLEYEDIKNWLDDLFYLDTATLEERKIKCKLDIWDGTELKESIKFKPKPFEKLLDKISDKKKCSSTVTISGDRTFDEDAKSLDFVDGKAKVKKKLMTKEVHLDVALRYGQDDQPLWDTYCNDTATIEFGTHKDVVEQVYCRYMQSAVNAAMTEAEKKRLKITWDDIRAGLYCVIHLSTDVEVGFVGNAKQKIDCPIAAPYISEIVSEGLNLIFDKDSGSPEILKQYIKIIKLNAKARLEAQKTKTATKVSSVDVFKEYQMKNYVRCNNSGKGQFRELKGRAPRIAIYV